MFGITTSSSARLVVVTLDSIVGTVEARIEACVRHAGSSR
jgi:hypothetical protein